MSNIELHCEVEPRKHQPRTREYNFRGKIHNEQGMQDWLTMFMGWCVISFVIAAVGIIVVRVLQ